MIFDVDVVIGIQRRIIERTGGKQGIRDLSLLESALNSVYQTFGSKDLYPSVVEKASRLCYALNRNHAFIDGNKRIAMHMLALFLRMHDMNYKPSNSEVIRVGLALASNQMSFDDLLIWVLSQIK